MKDTNQFHFFAASATTWATTNDERDLRALLRLMDEDGHSYNLFLVPVPHDTDYEINWYQPQVEGCKWLGMYETSTTPRGWAVANA